MILGLLIMAGICYITYQHFAAPFKIMKSGKETIANIEKNKEIMQDMVQNDKVLQERIKVLENNSEYNNLSQDKQAELIVDLIVERFNEIKQQQ